MQQSLFERLCPLLIVRLLPLRVFNDLNSSVVYGQIRNAPFMHGIFSSFTIQVVPLNSFLWNEDLIDSIALLCMLQVLNSTFSICS